MAINCSPDTPESFYREMMVRGIPVIETSRIPTSFSTHAVLMDKSLAAFHLGRGLLLSGHTQLASVEAPDSTIVLEALKLAIRRDAPTATVTPATPQQLDELIAQDITAAVCDGSARADQIRQLLEQRRLFPGCGEMSLCAIGTANPEICCNGYYIEPAAHASAVADLVRDLQPHRLSVLWLNGIYVDRGTVSSPGAPPEMATLLTPEPMGC